MGHRDRRSAEALPRPRPQPELDRLTVIENRGDLRSLAATTVLDHRLVRLDLPANAPREVVAETLAKVAGLAVRLCEAHGVGLVAMEEGLVKLRSGGRAKRRNHLLNSWDRTTLKAMLERRLGLRGASLVTVWAAYSATIGNVAFALPDACAAAAEIGRRGLVEQDWRARVRAARREGSLPKGGVGRICCQSHALRCGRAYGRIRPCPTRTCSHGCDRRGRGRRPIGLSKRRSLAFAARTRRSGSCPAAGPRARHLCRALRCRASATAGVRGSCSGSCRRRSARINPGGPPRRTIGGRAYHPILPDSRMIMTTVTPRSSRNDDAYGCILAARGPKNADGITGITAWIF